ncbi:MAG: PIN domain-containing protein [Nanoarchaeota archaeon]
MEESEIEYFFDTYAIIEILNSNPNYKKYVDKPAVITIFNLAEIYYFCLDNFDEDELEEIYSKYKDAVVDIEDETLKKAIKFRKEHKKKDISYTDAIGYIYAKEHGMKFLTGDKAFEGMAGVEYVKK